MKIAYLTGEFPRATDTFIQREVDELRKQGIEVQTWSVRRPKDSTVVSHMQEQMASSTRYLLPARFSVLAQGHFRSLVRSPREYLSAIRLAARSHRPGLKGSLLQIAYFAEAGMLADQLRSQGVTHLHNHFEDSSCSVAMLTSAVSGIPFSFAMHGSAIFFAPESWHLRTKLERAQFVTCVSWFTKSQGCLFVDEAHWSKLHIVHCGIDPTMYTPVRHEAGPTRIVFVARLAPGKGTEVLIDAFAKIAGRFPETSLDLVGSGPTLKTLQARVEALGLADRVVFHGAQAPADVARTLERAAVFVIASFAEGVPTVIMEAMGAGLPVIATHVGGVPEIVRDGENGYLVRPGDPDAVADRLAILLANPELRQQLGTAGRALVEADFDSSAESLKLTRLFSWALNT